MSKSLLHEKKFKAAINRKEVTIPVGHKSYLKPDPITLDKMEEVLSISKEKGATHVVFRDEPSGLFWKAVNVRLETDQEFHTRAEREWQLYKKANKIKA